MPVSAVHSEIGSRMLRCYAAQRGVGVDAPYNSAGRRGRRPLQLGGAPRTSPPTTRRGAGDVTPYNSAGRRGRLPLQLGGAPGTSPPTIRSCRCYRPLQEKQYMILANGCRGCRPRQPVKNHDNGSCGATSSFARSARVFHLPRRLIFRRGRPPGRPVKNHDNGSWGATSKTFGVSA